MTNSSITDVHDAVANAQLEMRVRQLIEKTRTELRRGKCKTKSVGIQAMLSSHRQELEDAYLNDVHLLNEAGKALAARGFDYELIDPETTFQTAYDRVFQGSRGLTVYQ